MKVRLGTALLVVSVAAALGGAAAVGGQAPPAPIALVGATLVDGTGAVPVPNAVVIVEGRVITAVGPAGRVGVPRGARTIDVRGKYVLPGFIDCHVHVTFPPDAPQASAETSSLATLRGLGVLTKYLRSGVTAVRDLGGPVEAMQALTEARELGYIDSIRVYPSGGLISVTGGHGDGTGASSVVADGPWEWRKAVRQMYRAGFRRIKITPTFTLEEVRAAVDEAKTLGMAVTAHGGGVSDTVPPTMTRLAVEAGVSCIEHVNPMDDDTLDLVARAGVFVVPTLSVYRASYEAGVIPQAMIRQRHWSMAMHEALFRKARAKGIVMGIGTDCAGPFQALYPGIYFTEMEYFVELGATRMEAIVAATRNGARILGLSDEMGTVEPGKLADLQVVGSDPLRSFDGLGQPEMVMVDGRLHR